MAMAFNAINTIDHLSLRHAMVVYDETSAKMLEYRHLINHPGPEIKIQWQLSGANEFGRTMQGVGKTRNKEDRVEGTNTMHLIHKKDIPKNKKIIYARFVSEI